MDALQILSQFGFPIVACIYIAIWTYKQNDNYRADIKELQKEHKEEITGLKESLDNNTLVLQKLIDRMDKEDKE